MQKVLWGVVCGTVVFYGMNAPERLILLNCWCFENGKIGQEVVFAFHQGNDKYVCESIP